MGRGRNTLKPLYILIGVQVQAWLDLSRTFTNFRLKTALPFRYQLLQVLVKGSPVNISVCWKCSQTPKHCPAVYNTQRQDFTTLTSRHDSSYFLLCRSDHQVNGRNMLLLGMCPCMYLIGHTALPDDITFSCSRSWARLNAVRSGRFTPYCFARLAWFKQQQGMYVFPHRTKVCLNMAEPVD